MGLKREKAGWIQRRSLKNPMSSEEFLKICYAHIKANAQSGWLYCQVPKIRIISKENLAEVIQILTNDGYFVNEKDEEISIGW